MNCPKCGNDNPRQWVDNGETATSPTFQLMCKKCNEVWFPTTELTAVIMWESGRRDDG
jgi:Zn-finger nucleic acid-binding protein